MIVQKIYVTHVLFKTYQKFIVWNVLLPHSLLNFKKWSVGDDRFWGVLSEGQKEKNAEEAGIKETFFKNDKK
jgi:hypothetical protein